MKRIFKSARNSLTRPLALVTFGTLLLLGGAALFTGLQYPAWAQQLFPALTDLTDVTAKSGTGTTVVMQSSPTITTPTIADMSNATHDHSNAAGGGTIAASAIGSGTITHERGGIEADISAYDGLIQIKSGTASQIKTKMDATTGPTVNNDTSEGYVIGSEWHDITNDVIYKAIDVTDGAAVWKDISAAGGTGAPSDAPYLTTTNVVGLTAEVNIQALNDSLAIKGDDAAGRTITIGQQSTNADSVTIDVPKANVTVNGVEIADVSSSETFSNKTLASPTVTGTADLGTSTLQFSEAGQDIIGSGTGLVIDVPAGDTVNIDVAATDELTVSATQINLHNNAVINATIDANGTGNAITNIETADLASAAKTGADTAVVTGTAGTSGNLLEWNADGDAIEASVAQDTLLGRTSTGAGDVEELTISSITEEASPASGDWLLGMIAEGNLRRIDINSLPSASTNDLTPTASKTTAYTAVAGDLVLTDASGGSFAVTLPASPSDGDQVGIFAYGDPGGNSVTVDRNGNKVDSGTDTSGYQLLRQGDTVVFQYKDASAGDPGWMPIVTTFGGELQTGVTAAGTTQGAGTVLTGSVVEVTTSTATDDAVTLRPITVAGVSYSITNNDSADTIHIFPGSGDAIAGAAVDAAYDLTAGNAVLLVALDTTNWEVFATTAGSGGISNVVEDTTPQLGGDLDLNGNNIDFPTTANISDVLDEDNMASDSATALATQQSIKAYADLKTAKASNLSDVADATTSFDNIAPTSTQGGMIGHNGTDNVEVIPFYHVDLFGATTGGGDDTTAIQAAVDAASAAGGGVVTFSSGTYDINASIVWKEGVAFQGAGGGPGNNENATEINCTFASADDAFDATAAPGGTNTSYREDVFIKDLIITGASTTNYRYAIDALKPSGLVIEGVRITGFDHCIRLRDGIWTRINNCFLEGVDSIAGSVGILYDTNTGVQGTTLYVTDCYFQQGEWSVILKESACDRIYFSNCLFESTVHGIAQIEEDVQEVYFSHCHSEAVGADGTGEDMFEIGKDGVTGTGAEVFMSYCNWQGSSSGRTTRTAFDVDDATLFINTCQVGDVFEGIISTNASTTVVKINGLYAESTSDKLSAASYDVAKVHVQNFGRATEIFGDVRVAEYEIDLSSTDTTGNVITGNTIPIAVHWRITETIVNAGGTDFDLTFTNGLSKTFYEGEGYASGTDRGVVFTASRRPTSTYGVQLVPDAGAFTDGTILVRFVYRDVDDRTTIPTPEMDDLAVFSSFTLPNSATPTVDANGELAWDNTVTDFSTGLLRTYGNGEEQFVVTMPVAQATTPTDGHVIKYNATNDEFELGAAGAADNLGNHTATEIIKSETFGIQFDGAGQDIIGDAGGITYDVPSGDTHEFHVNSSLVMSVDTTWLDMHSNTIINAVLVQPHFSDGGTIQDSLDNEQIRFSTTSSAVNHIQIKNAATGNGPQISAIGDDTNVDLKLSAKGTGEVNVTSDVQLDESLHFGTVITNTISANAATLELGDANHQILDLTAATGAVTITINGPAGACSGTLVILQDDTARDITWAKGTGVTTGRWLGTEPTWSSDTVSSYRAVSWIYDGSANLFLSAAAEQGSTF